MRCPVIFVLQVNQESWIDVRSTFFVVNPDGDLKKTEQQFGEWFRSEAGWEGVVGTPPKSDQLSAALQEKDLYMYAVKRYAETPQYSGHSCTIQDKLVSIIER